MIVCKDGFRSTTVGEEQFHVLTANVEAEIKIVEIDESSLFCRLMRKKTNKDN